MNIVYKMNTNMNKLIDTCFIQPIGDIIRKYMLPDYKLMFDAVVRDLNWVAGHEAKLRLGKGELYSTPMALDERMMPRMMRPGRLLGV
jgi:hypothetical protein